MRDTLRHLKVAAAWRLLEICYWGEQLIWKRYDQAFVVL